MTKIAIYPGSFDPVTLGHLDIVTRASRLFDHVIMAVVVNPGKNSMFDLDTRIHMIEEALGSMTGVTVESFEGLTVDFARSREANVIIRGLRAISDFELEFQMSQMNKTLHPKLETLFMMAKQDFTFLSSSMVKEVALLGGDVSSLVPASVQTKLRSVNLNR